ncbi:SMC family ATPase [Candidatus Woesearchaeota archaeon]|nr:MAG: SMC family ATPase [Candidatus Woesearchaeota archaeon]
MRIEKLKLRNIRSYTSANIDFPDGIVLLSGDIGAGKSTILLAIEFALFGLLRSEISGSALLRNGEIAGEVELTFKVKGRKYIIKRTLKRTQKRVEQSSGHLIIDDVKQEATPTELKSLILQILGYPSDLLNKAKNFLYRYTVYTPQEDMKRILLDPPDVRLAILRKVFGVDKYARIAENANSYAKALRERKRALALVSSDLSKLKQELEDNQKKLKESKESASKLAPEIKSLQEKIASAKNLIQSLEKERERAEKISQEYTKAQTEAEIKMQQQERAENEIKAIGLKLANTQIIVPDSQKLEVREKELAQKHREHEKNSKEIQQKIATLRAEEAHSKRITDKILTLDQCPTCQQKVTQEHKQDIMGRHRKKEEELNLKIEEYNKNALDSKRELEQINRELERLREEIQKVKVLKIKAQHAKDFEERKARLEREKLLIEKQIADSKRRITELSAQKESLAQIGLQYAQARKELEDLAAKERALSIEHTRIIEICKSHEKRISQLSEEIERKNRARKQLEKTEHTHQFLTDMFNPMITTIEKHVMARIHHEFNALFSDWFCALVENTMRARVDDSFTPIIEQNGHDTNIEYLSGGERTACALAYRLALNATINSLISAITTKDLLILDEPTDGFSSEQLDHLREVLSQLKLSQIIIVSHEQKIEGFADHIIRIRKEEHKSQITMTN